ncbi:hypothetical protein APSETT445_005088 [Aspergillus pseudonomiae]
MSTILGGSSKLTLAKIIDIWGRVEGFLFMLLIVVIGLIMKATCKNIETYVAAHTLYWVGHIGMMYVVDIMLADMTTLKNRMIMLGINGTPSIASTFAGPRIANLFYINLDFRWAFGAFAIMITGTSIPVVGVMLYMQRRAHKVGALEKTVSDRTWWQSLVHYFIEFDEGTPNKYSLIRYTGEFKWTVFTGIPILLLGTALLIPFRQPNTHVGILTMTQILVGLGTCIFTVCGQLAMMAPVTHQEIAVVMAIWGLFGSIGAAVGSAIAGGMWNNILPGELYTRLPEDSKHMSRTIFSDMVMQMSYADGSPEREAIVGAYADVQRKMVIAGVCFVPLCIGCVWIWRNINVKRLDREQTRGNVW